VDHRWEGLWQAGWLKNRSMGLRILAGVPIKKSSRAVQAASRDPGGLVGGLWGGGGGGGGGLSFRGPFNSFKGVWGCRKGEKKRCARSYPMRRNLWKLGEQWLKKGRTKGGLGSENSQ